MKKILIFSFIFILSLGIALSLSIDWEDGRYDIKNHMMTTPLSEEEIVENCKNLSLEETSKCFRDNVVTFYNYKDAEPRYTIKNGNGFLTSIDQSQSIWIERSIETNIGLLEYLKENGGVCSEWTLLYNELCSETDFGCDSVIIEGVEGVIEPHQYAIMYTEDAYCKLDQTIIKCSEIAQ